ncbi:hypothetical protein FRC19_010679 [Serendipita sp. 401]|nr:hypothetical protein FRC19_010679 [Serendipita sp. 401]
MQTEVELPPGYDLADYTLRWSDRFGPLKCCTWVFKGTPKDSEDRYVCVGRNAMFFIQADVFEYHVLDLTPDEAFEDFCEKDPICDVWDKRGEDIKIETTYKPQLLRIFSSQIGEAFTVIPRNRVNTWRNKIDWSEELSPKEIKNGKATLKEVLPVYIEYWKTIGREAATYSQSITTSVAKGGGYGRYWLPKLTTPVPIYFFSDTLSTRDLKKIVEAVMSKPSNSKNPGYTSFEPRFTSPPNKKLVCISVHPFGYYRTLLEPNDLQTLVKAQMESSKPGQDKWIREIPKKNIAEQFHGAMADALARKTVELKSLKRDNRTTRTRFDLNLGDLVSGPDRKGTDTFMGQSANKWATQILGWGPSASNGNEVVAEWLHRSAHSFGKLNDGTSPDLPFNIMFGTQECNTHMCRAENMIHRTNALAKDLKKQAPQTSLSSLHPTQHAIWHQITKGQGTIQVQLPGVEVKGAAIASDPKSPQTPSSPCPPPHGFMVVGKIDLFNLHLDLPDLTFNSWHGPPPARVTLPRNTLPIYQHVEISQIHVADVIPLLEETPFKTFLLHNVVIMYQNCHFIPSKSIGWHFEGDITIDQSYGLMHTILTEQLKVLEENLDVHLHASLGPDFSWKEPPSLTGLCFEGSLNLAPKDGGPDMKPTGIQVNDRVTLTAAGVRLFGIGSHTLGMDTKLQMTYDYQVNGALLLKVDGTLMPLEFNFAVSEQSGAAQLSGMLSGNIWSNVFGSGITLADVWILCSMDGAFNFEMGGTLKAGLTSISLSLQVSEGKYELTGEVEDLGIDGVIDIFEHLTGERLNPPGHVDITIGDATLVISNSGLSLNVEHMKIDKYESLSGAQVSISKTSGIHIRASIENQPFDDITLENASVDLVIARDASVWTTDVSLNGIVNFLDGSAKATATVHLYKSGSQLEWTVYGKFVDSQDGYPLANLLPIVKESFLGNLMLQEAALIVASQSGPDPSPHNSQRYDIQQGVQICAILGEISSFGSLLRRPTPMLTLRAAWSKKTGFILDILLPSPISIHIGRGITTDPIIAQLQTNPVGLLIEAGIKVPVAGSSAPLDFNASLTVDSDHVAIAAEMDGLWVDPFGIGQDVAVGPRVALKVEINLPLFCATGTPTTIGLEAGLQVGQAKADIAVIMSEDPSQELLTGKIDHLTVPNLVHFFNEVTGLDIPEPPDFFDFNTVNLYMSEGVTIGKQAYPAGFSFDASMNIFGTTLTAHAGITGGTFALNAAVDKIDIGPLTISGHDGKPLTLDLTFGTTVQHLHFDGEIDFIGIKAATLLVLDLQPSPAFSFDFLLSFTELLQFKVDAHMSGETVDVKDLSKLDFELHAEMEQHILDYIRDQVKAALEKARKTEISAFDSAQKTLLDAKAEYQKNLTSAQADMTSKYESWQKHSQDVHMASQRVIDGYTNQMNKLQSNVDAERQKFNLALKDAEAKLETANSDRAAKMQAAKANLAGEKNKWDTEIANKESALEAAKAQLQQRFGSAEQDIDNAEAKVNSLQNQINSVESTINDYENAHWYEVWKKLAIPGLGVEVAGLEIAMNTADAVLGLAKGVVEGVDYLTVKGAIPIAEGALADVQKAGDAALDVATKLVDEADKITAVAVSLAEDALTGVQKGGDALWKGAEKALADFIATGKAILEGAQKAIDDLVHCAEWLAYQAAEAGLSIAKAATHAIDVANFALEGIKDAGSIIMQVAEDIVEAVLNLFEITKVTLDGKFSGMHHGGDGFDVSVTFKVGGGQPETVGLKLHLGGVVDFIQGLLEEILKKLTQTGVHG